ncbi:MAG: hypothetical protein EAZ53_15585 [Bacteroidetes bacterium]|nr:MAG: hypothetical protein EAZ53_15585 [Bacteroidota bacterium]
MTLKNHIEFSLLHYDCIPDISKQMEYKMILQDMFYLHSITLDDISNNIIIDITSRIFSVDYYMDNLTINNEKNTDFITLIFKLAIGLSNKVKISNNIINIFGFGGYELDLDKSSDNDLKIAFNLLLKTYVFNLSNLEFNFEAASKNYKYNIIKYMYDTRTYRVNKFKESKNITFITYYIEERLFYDYYLINNIIEKEKIFEYIKNEYKKLFQTL